MPSLWIDSACVDHLCPPDRPLRGTVQLPQRIDIQEQKMKLSISLALTMASFSPIVLSQVERDLGEYKDYFKILPSFIFQNYKNLSKIRKKYKFVKGGFEYNSKNNTNYLNVNEIKKLNRSFINNI